jgi:hypothetical protein
MFFQIHPTRIESCIESMLPSISQWTSTNTHTCFPRWIVFPNTYWYKMNLFTQPVVTKFLIQTGISWWRRISLSFQFLDLFWPIHRYFNSTVASCSESMLPSISQWTSTNTQTCFPSWIVLPNTYWYKMIPNNNISFCYIFGIFWPIRHNHFNSTLESCSESMLPSISQWSSTNTNNLFPQLNSSS